MNRSTLSLSATDLEALANTVAKAAAIAVTTAVVEALSLAPKAEAAAKAPKAKASNADPVETFEASNGALMERNLVTGAVRIIAGPKKAPKAKAPKANRMNGVAKPATKSRALCKATRDDFVKAASWAKGVSNREIARLVLSGEKDAPAGFHIGDGYRTLLGY